MGHLTVFGTIVLEVSIKQIQVGTADSHLPDAGAHHPSGQLDADGLPDTVLVKHGLGGNLEEVLSLVFSHLIAGRSKSLGEVSVPVEKTHGNQVDIHIAGLLEVVSGEDSQTSGIYLERGVQAILHTEVCY